MSDCRYWKSNLTSIFKHAAEALRRGPNVFSISGKMHAGLLLLRKIAFGQDRAATKKGPTVPNAADLALEALHQSLGGRELCRHFTEF